MWFLLNSKTKQHWLQQVHFIPYYIHYNPQKHPKFPWKESSMPQNKMEKENGQYFKEDCSTFLVYLYLYKSKIRAF